MRIRWIEIALLGTAACRGPTQITVELTTDVPCGELGGTSITVGELGAIEDKPAAAQTVQCSEGRIGSLVAVPAGEGSSEIAFKVVTSVGAPLEACVAPSYGSSCIVARRALAYLEHEPLFVPVAMRRACQGVQCPPDQTCVNGQCRPARVGPDGEPPPPSLPAEPFAVTFGGAGDDRATAVSVDASGDVYVTGRVVGAVDFGADTSDPVGVADAFIARFGSDGTLRWVTRIGASVDIVAQAIAVDGVGNSYVAGVFNGIAELEEGLSFISLGGSDDIFVASFDASGAFRWAKPFGGSTGDRGNGIAVDKGGNVYVTGRYAFAVDFGGGPLPSTSSDDIMLVSLSGADGSHNWSLGLGSTGTDEGHAVAVADDGTVYLAAEFVGTVDFGGESHAAAGIDIALASFTAAGEYRWSRTMGGGVEDEGLGIAVAGNLLVATGRFNGTVEFDAGEPLTSGGWDLFVAAYTHDGTPRWVVPGRGGSDASGVAVALGLDGTVHLTGEYDNALDLGSELLAPAFGSQNAFVARLIADGGVESAQTLGGMAMDSGLGIAADAVGNRYAVGNFTGPAGFLGENYPGNGGTDAYLVKLGPP